MGTKKEPKARRRAGEPERFPKTVSQLAGSSGSKPVFSFAHADCSCPHEHFGFTFTGDHATEVVQFMVEMSKLTWAGIEAMRSGPSHARHKKHHSQSVGALGTDARERVRQLRLNETFDDDVFRFRLTGRKRLWGYRTGSVFHVLWWDPDHKVCPTEPH